MINCELAKEIGATHHIDNMLYKFDDNAQALCYFFNIGWELSENSSETMSRLERIDFDTIAQADSEEWKNGDSCIFNDIECVFIGISASHPSVAIVEYLKGFISVNDRVYVEELRKPEAPQQREERERLEAAFEVYLAFWSASKSTVITMNMSEFKECTDLHYWLAVVDKTGYRKQSK